MRATIIIAALLAVSYAAPLDKPADPVPTSSPALEASTILASTTEPSFTSTLVPESSSISAPAPAVLDVISAEHPAPAPHDNHPQAPAAHPIQELKPNRLENQPPVPNIPEPDLLTSSPQPHHVEEHELNHLPNKPSNSQHVLESELDLNDEEIAFLEAVGTLAVNYELALLQELEKEYDRDHRGNKHGHKHHNSDHKHQHHNSPNKDDDDEDCDCSASIMYWPELEHTTKH